MAENNIDLDYSDIKPYLKTGDIILFSCNKHESILAEIGYLCRTKLLGCAFGHVGMVLQSSGHLYLLECTSYDHTAYPHATYLNGNKCGGVRIIDLETIIAAYHKENKGFFAVKLISNAIDNNQLLARIQKYATAEFEDKSILFLLAFIDIFISHDVAAKYAVRYQAKSSKQKMMCSEFVYSILSDCNLINSYCRKMFWPHFYVNGKFDRLTKVKYSEPLVFTYEKVHYKKYNRSNQ